jgi:hypothetical protein
MRKSIWDLLVFPSASLPVAWRNSRLARRLCELSSKKIGPPGEPHQTALTAPALGNSANAADLIVTQARFSIPSLLFGYTTRLLENSLPGRVRVG